MSKELKDFVGPHWFSGIDTGSIPKKEYYDDDASFIRFKMDGIVYRALEDPSDGYRSSLSTLEEVKEKCDYNFPKQKVIGKMRPDSDYCKNDVIEFFDAKTNLLVLAIGTDNWDDYYPTCVLEYHPENMFINKNK